MSATKKEASSPSRFVGVLMRLCSSTRLRRRILMSSTFCYRSWMMDVSPTAKGASSISRTRDRKSTRLNSSHQIISYAVFCLKKKKQIYTSSKANMHLRYISNDIICIIALKNERISCKVGTGVDNESYSLMHNEILTSNRTTT